MGGTPGPQGAAEVQAAVMIPQSAGTFPELVGLITTSALTKRTNPSESRSEMRREDEKSAIQF